MKSHRYESDCKGCQVSQGIDVPGGVVRLPGNWRLNSYGGSEGFLGWLALQPRYHRMSLAELLPDELRELGPNIRAIDRAITQYWKEEYSDPVERLYVIYFFESADEEPFHLHLHLIPRFRSLSAEMRAWKVAKATKNKLFPSTYTREAVEYADRVRRLMDYLRHELER